MTATVVGVAADVSAVRCSTSSLRRALGSEGTLQPRRRAWRRSAASALAAAADDDRDRARRARVARSSRAATPAPRRTPWCRPPTAPASSRCRRSRASSRSRGGGNGSPNAACSRSHQPAPTPTNARPPVSASSVAAALAVMPGARNVTGVTSVPSSRPVPRPASAPSVTQGSGIGDQARSDLGDLDEVVHQGQTCEPGRVGRRREVASATRAGPRPTGSG